MASATLAACEILMLPSSFYLLQPDNSATACLTLPLVVASDPWIQVQGLRCSVFMKNLDHQALTSFSVSELRRSMVENKELDQSQVLDLACASVQVWRSETIPLNTGDAERPLVTVDVNLTISPLKIQLHACQLRALQEWAASVQEPEMPVLEVRETPAPKTATTLLPRNVPAAASRVRLAMLLRSSMAVDVSFIVDEVAALRFQLPSLSAQLRQIEDHFSARLRIARPHVSLESEDEPPLEIVEWCEEGAFGPHCMEGLRHLYEKVGEEPRKRAWLRVKLSQRGEQPLSVVCSSLPIGLCVAASPLLTFAASFTAQSRPVNLPTSPKTPRKPQVQLAPPHPEPVAPTPIDLQVELGTVSLRLFSGHSQANGAPFMVLCVNEASMRSVPSTTGLEGKAVLSLSLFEKRQVRSGSVASAEELVSEADSRCLVDDLVAPCNVRLLPISEASSGQRLVVEGIAVDLGKQMHLLQLLRLAKDCAAAAAILTDPSVVPSVKEDVVPTVPDASKPSGQEIILEVKTLTLKIPGEELFLRLASQGL
eukprot:symbB.v1.2.008154.t1/scaffold510.1/size193565/4